MYALLGVGEIAKAAHKRDDRYIAVVVRICSGSDANGLGRLTRARARRRELMQDFKLF